MTRPRILRMREQAIIRDYEYALELARDARQSGKHRRPALREKRHRERDGNTQPSTQSQSCAVIINAAERRGDIPLRRPSAQLRPGFPDCTVTVKVAVMPDKISSGASNGTTSRCVSPY